MLSGPSEEESTQRDGAPVTPQLPWWLPALLLLTADNEVDWAAGAIAGGIERAARERAPVVPGHVDDDEGGASVGGVDSVAGCDLRAAVEPQEGEGGAGGDRTLQDSWALPFSEGGLVHTYGHIRNSLWAGQRRSDYFQKAMKSCHPYLKRVRVKMCNVYVIKALQHEICIFLIRMLSNTHEGDLKCFYHWCSMCFLHN